MRDENELRSSIGHEQNNGGVTRNEKGRNQHIKEGGLRTSGVDSDEPIRDRREEDKEKKARKRDWKR